MPTQKPDNEIIRIAESTVNLPSTGKVNKQVPSYDLRTVGYDKNYRIFAEELNYTLDNIGQWCQWFENRVDELQLTTEDLLDQIEKERVSVGELIEITGDHTNPSVLKGYGTWEYFGQGLTTIGVGSHIDDRSEELTFTDGEVSGEYRHVQTEGELAQHTPSVTSLPHTHRVLGSTITEDTNNPLEDRAFAGEGDPNPAYTNLGWQGAPLVESTSVTVEAEVIGNSDPMNNIQPSIAVYRWKRVS